MRHLTQAFALGALRRGAQVEQFVGPVGRGLRFVTIYRLESALRVSVHDVEDVGSDDFLDITEFPPLDDEEDFGVGKLVFSGATPEEALAFSDTQLGTSPDRWVNQGVVCDEYVDFRQNMR